MSLRDAYLRGSVLLGGTGEIAILVEDPESAAGKLAQEAERAAAEIEADERAVLQPFEPEQRTEPAAPPASTPTLTSVPRVLKSEIPNVSDAAWTSFVLTMKTAQPGAISASNDLGMFEIKTRRLADLGLVKDLKRARSPSNRLMWVCEFIPPLTQREFLSKPAIQYDTFIKSMRAYIEGLRDGSVPKPDGGFLVGTSLSGVLAVLHRCGPSGLKGWNDPDDRFPNTVALYERSNGIF